MELLSRQELQEKIDSFDYWHYRFDLGDGVVINPTNQEYAQKRLDLRDYIWPAVLDLFGGSLKGIRVLDIACNSGFWSLEAQKSGADHVLGFDARPERIQQAELVRDALGIAPEHLEYQQMDVYDLSPETVGGKYDLVLMLRVLNHLSNPLLALRKVREVCDSYLVADIKLVKDDKPILSVLEESQADPRNAVDSGLALRPSLSAVELMVPYCGFTEMRAIPPRSPLPESYFDGRRTVFTARASA